MREGVRLITCWPTMLVGDLIDEIAQAVGITVTGRRHKRVMQVVEHLRGCQDVMLVFDETENLRGRDVKCVEVLRMIWDAVQTPIVFCGTYQLVDMLTRGSGWQNLAQLYRRNWACNLKGISEPEVRDILRNYNITPDATNMLVKVALDVKHGGMGNFVELLDISLEAAAGGAVDSGIVQGAKQFKLLY